MLGNFIYSNSNLMWTATWALNTLIGKGKAQDRMVHMLGQAVAAYTDATIILDGGYKTLTCEDVKTILRNSL